MHMDNGIEFPLKRLCRAGIPPRRQASLTHGGQDGRPTSHLTLSFTSTLCRAGILPRHQASLPLAAKMAALHLSQRYHSPQRYVGRGFFPAIRLPCPWRPGWPPYIYLNVIIYLNVV
jgi:hypothetical protein